MKIRSNVKAGITPIASNHNEKQTKSLTVKSGIKAGINFTSTVSKSSPTLNHNEKLKSAKLFAKKLRLSKETIRIFAVKTGVKAGGINTQHNEKLNISDSIEKKSFGKKLRLSKETVKELKNTELKRAVGGGVRPSNHPLAC